MHIEHTCRAASTFLPPHLRDPGAIRPRQWRAWLTCAPPFDRHPTARKIFVAYEFSDIHGFIAVMHDSLFGGYRADIAGLYVLPVYRRRHTATALLVAAAQWLQEDGISRVTAAWRSVADVYRCEWQSVYRPRICEAGNLHITTACRIHRQVSQRRDRSVLHDNALGREFNACEKWS